MSTQTPSQILCPGGALALTVVNVTSFSPLFGLTLALEPLYGRAYGAKDFRAMVRRHLSLLFLLLCVELFFLH